MIRTVAIGGQGSPELGRLHNHDRVPQTQCPHLRFELGDGTVDLGKSRREAGNCIVVHVTPAVTDKEDVTLVVLLELAVVHELCKQAEFARQRVGPIFT